LKFKGEAPLPEAIQGSSTFVKTFPSRGPGREFELKTRLFTSRVSYMLRSPAFEALPEPIRIRIISSL
jgi:hypothetical protein